MNKTLSKVIMIRTNRSNENKTNTEWKVSKYEVFSGPYFHVFSSSTGKYGPEKSPYLDTFDAMKLRERTEPLCSASKENEKRILYSSDEKNICDSKTFWKIAKPMSSKKIKSNKRITLTENDAIIKTEKGFNH